MFRQLLSWDDGSGRITVIRSKADVKARGAVVAITSADKRWVPYGRLVLTAERGCPGCWSRKPPGG